MLKGANGLPSDAGGARADAGATALMNGGAPRRGRLSKAAEFERVYRRGRSVANRYLVLYRFSAEQGGTLRLGLSVPRRVGGAVTRNKVKRLIREAFRSQLAERQLAGDIVVVARADAAELAEREGLQGIEAALADLLRKVGMALGDDREGGARGEVAP